MDADRNEPSHEAVAPIVAPTVATTVGDAPIVDPDPDELAVRDELAVLDELESDLVAVEQAIAQLDDVTLSGVGGRDAVERIDTAVSQERFGTPEHPQVDPGRADPVSP